MKNLTKVACLLIAVSVFSTVLALNNKYEKMYPAHYDFQSSGHTTSLLCYR